MKKRALVTGAAGFVGRHMMDELERRGYKTTGVDLVASPHVNVHVADAVKLFIHETQVYDLVVHCAYNVGGRAMINGNSLVMAKNLTLDAMMFDWAIRTQQQRVLYFSSSAAYPIRLQGHNMAMRLNEDFIEWECPMTNDTEAIIPDGRYGWAKLTGEQLARSAWQAGLQVHVVRPFSGYGSDQSLDYPFPMFIDRVVSRTPQFDIWGSASQVRDWIHIDDVIAGALAIVDANVQTPINLGNGYPVSMGDLASRMMQIAGHDVPINVVPGPMGVMYRVADTTTMRSHYVPQVSLQEGIERALKERHDSH